MESGTSEQIVREKHQVPLGISGLGGWLVLVHIGLYGSIVGLFVLLFQYSLPAIYPETWEFLTSKSSEVYHALWGPAIIFELVYNILLILFSVYSLIQFYRKKAIFPRLMIIFYSVSFIVGVIDSVLLYQIPLAREMEDSTIISDAVRPFLTCAIWIPYFLKSVRVKNTFVK
ncbi:hypothetical protein BK133_04260 [Paenibacillus sp. FSL H8-0548]|uniref:DUF2569 domain-containing protein n=1 Tax=Paenibacillus sp. FSL H8-0548 TaxID=1920422 RepID=UPI00096C8CA1|nr:DUF2569 domain-containing protein [Paenibacillus sp. FSL H8-0548]OMF37757.1 hypothetical protein BK133_04260 [Paenibacillus sp. FSL H8-0548]